MPREDDEDSSEYESSEEESSEYESDSEEEEEVKPKKKAGRGNAALEAEKRREAAKSGGKKEKAGWQKKKGVEEGGVSKIDAMMAQKKAEKAKADSECDFRSGLKSSARGPRELSPRADEPDAKPDWMAKSKARGNIEIKKEEKKEEVPEWMQKRRANVGKEIVIENKPAPSGSAVEPSGKPAWAAQLKKTPSSGGGVKPSGSTSARGFQGVPTASSNTGSMSARPAAKPAKAIDPSLKAVQDELNLLKRKYQEETSARQAAQRNLDQATKSLQEAEKKLRTAKDDSTQLLARIDAMSDAVSKLPAAANGTPAAEGDEDAHKKLRKVRRDLKKAKGERDAMAAKLKENGLELPKTRSHSKSSSSKSSSSSGKKKSSRSSSKK
eukprot:TRINITY_DN175_c0_g1_i1.p2 TRINITY_DN175_c0_g1~~TRINITY_DN175_c0_g1_i1.p2  ORF type:complete len:406 (+),score=170.81 TRINITY_DN175_c0_g1_i1:74-1219(+)